MPNANIPFRNSPNHTFSPNFKLRDLFRNRIFLRSKRHETLLNAHKKELCAIRPLPFQKEPPMHEKTRENDCKNYIANCYDTDQLSLIVYQYQWEFRNKPQLKKQLISKLEFLVKKSKRINEFYIKLSIPQTYEPPERPQNEEEKITQGSAELLKMLQDSKNKYISMAPTLQAAMSLNYYHSPRLLTTNENVNNPSLRQASFLNALSHPHILRAIEKIEKKEIQKLYPQNSPEQQLIKTRRQLQKAMKKITAYGFRSEAREKKRALMFIKELLNQCGDTKQNPDNRDSTIAVRGKKFNKYALFLLIRQDSKLNEALKECIKQINSSIETANPLRNRNKKPDLEINAYENFFPKNSFIPGLFKEQKPASIISEFWNKLDSRKNIQPIPQPLTPLDLAQPKSSEEEQKNSKTNSSKKESPPDNTFSQVELQTIPLQETSLNTHSPQTAPSSKEPLSAEAKNESNNHSPIIKETTYSQLTSLLSQATTPLHTTTPTIESATSPLNSSPRSKSVELIAQNNTLPLVTTDLITEENPPIDNLLDTTASTIQKANSSLHSSPQGRDDNYSPMILSSKSNDSFVSQGSFVTDPHEVESTNSHVMENDGENDEQEALANMNSLIFKNPRTESGCSSSSYASGLFPATTSNREELPPIPSSTQNNSNSSRGMSYH